MDPMGLNVNHNWLVVEPTHLQNILVKLDHFPGTLGENKKYLSYHHLDIQSLGILIK